MKRIAYDCSSFMWTCLSGGVDDENGRKVEFEGKQVQINSAQYGYDKVMSRMLGVLNHFKLTPIRAILVFEGERSKAKRLAIDSTYKAGKGRGGHAPESYEEFHKLKAMLTKTWLELGALALTQDLAEGDDTLAWLAHNAEDDLVIATFDNDLAALNMIPNAYGATVEVWVNDMVAVNKYGLFDFPLIATYKALVGDTSDNIKGVTGFGAAAFEKFCIKYGFDGLAELQDMLEASNLKPLEEMAAGKDDPLVTKIMDQKDQMQRSYDLARLRPEWVDTMSHPLKWQVGMVRQVQKTDDIRLKQWYGRVKLVKPDEFDDYVEWALEKIAQGDTVALDVETSGCDEGDEWLELQRSKGKSAGVDVFGAELASVQITFGDNNQYTAYLPIDHVDTENNIETEKVRQFIERIPRHIPLVIQNTAFELVVLDNAWGKMQRDNGFHGFLPNVLDTKIEASYVNENMSLGLKERSKHYLNYDQASYDSVTILTGPADELPKGGKLVSENYLYRDVATGKMEPTGEVDDDGTVLMTEVIKRELVEYDTGEVERDDDGEPVLKKGKTIPVMAPVIESVTRQYRMNELTSRHCLSYGADDPITTAALHNFYQLHMQMDHHYKVYLDVEIGACYLHAKNFIDGVPISLEEMKAQADEDTLTYNKAWGGLRQYLIKNGWEGVTPPVYDRQITVAQVKEAFAIVTGQQLDTQMRTMSKLITYIREVKDQPVLAALLERMVDPAVVDPDMIKMHEKAFTKHVGDHFAGEPEFNDDSSLQMCNLLYKVMGLPIKVRNKPTDIMRSKGITEGNPKANALAIEYGLQDAETDEVRACLEALKLMSMVGTRRSLYYNKYPYFPHWKDGLVRSQHNQCHANTRRASTSKPNLQQLPKHPKIEGYKSRFRAIIRPHKPGAVVVSIDFDSQEMRIIAELSQDERMLSMFVGENLTGPHSLTGLAIAIRKMPNIEWSYEKFEQIREVVDHELFSFVKGCRVLGKKLNFVAEYGAMAAKVAETLMISEEEAQELIDAREDMFPEVKAWKQRRIAAAKKTGKAFTMLGAVRHLRDAFMSDDRFESSKAERQAVNFEVQSSSGEQTKQAESRMWEDSLFYDFDAVCYGPIHDEVVASVMIEDLFEFLPRMHACMAVQYACMKVPCVGSIAFGPDFYSQIEVGTEPTRDAIAKGIEKLNLPKQLEAA
jgi:DNA polymerase I-like protein with 3'-5' exonuclease and polymerase domains/5'-3' exonuclease